MLNYIIAAIIGIVAYQIIIFIIYLCTKQNDELLATLGVGFPWLCISIINPIYEKVRFAWCKKNLNAYRLCWLKEDGTVSGSLHAFYATDKVISKLVQDDTKPYFVKLVSTGKDWDSAPDKEDIYKGQDKFKNYDMNKFRKTPNS